MIIIEKLYKWIFGLFKMVTEDLGGNIKLVRFSLVDEEKIVAKKVIGRYAEKIRNISNYDELKLEMKVSDKRKSKKFEIKVHLLVDGKTLTSEREGFNFFVLLDEVMRKILAEAEHKLGKKK